MDKREHVNKSDKFIGEDKNFYASRRYSKAKTYPMHRHEYFEIEIVLSGSAKQNLNGEMYDLKRGSVYFLTNTDFHELIITEPLLNYNISMNLLSVSPEFMKKSLSATQRVFVPAPDQFKRLCLLAELIEETSSNYRNTNPSYSRMLLSCLLLQMSELFDSDIKNKIGVSSVIQNVILYLHANFRNNPSLDEVADFAQLSRNYLSNLFKKEIGMTLIRYCAALKIGYAKRLLSITDMPITDICFDCGFNSIPNFIRTFNLHTGCSPQKYRKAARSGEIDNAYDDANNALSLFS